MKDAVFCALVLLADKVPPHLIGNWLKEHANVGVWHEHFALHNSVEPTQGKEALDQDETHDDFIR
eukprot:15350211-Ditylum_brightwellii.AAC.1